MITIPKYEEIARTKDDAAFKEISSSLYWTYFTSKRIGSDDLFLDDVKWDNEVAPLVAECREYGIKQIAFGSTWSGAIKTAWEFVKCGCTIEGMKEVPIDRESIDPFTKMPVQEKVPALIIKIN